MSFEDFIFIEGRCLVSLLEICMTDAVMGRCKVRIDADGLFVGLNVRTSALYLPASTW